MKAVEKNPDDPQLLQNLAVAYRGAEKYQQAVVYYERVLKLQPNNTGAMFDVGHCYAKTGQKKKAIDMYTQYADAVEAKDPNAAQRAAELIHNLRR